SANRSPPLRDATARSNAPWAKGIRSAQRSPNVRRAASVRGGSRSIRRGAVVRTLTSRVPGPIVLESRQFRAQGVGSPGRGLGAVIGPEPSELCSSRHIWAPAFRACASGALLDQDRGSPPTLVSLLHFGRSRARLLYRAATGVSID